MFFNFLTRLKLLFLFLNCKPPQRLVLNKCIIFPIGKLLKCMHECISKVVVMVYLLLLYMFKLPFSNLLLERTASFRIIYQHFYIKDYPLSGNETVRDHYVCGWFSQILRLSYYLMKRTLHPLSFSLVALCWYGRDDARIPF